MRLTMVTAALVLAFSGGAAMAAPPQIEIKDAVARITVIPETRGDIKVEVLSSNAQTPVKVSTRGDKVVLDGGLQRKIKSCRGEGAQVVVEVAGIGDVRYAQMSRVVIRTPRDVRIEAGGAVFGAVGRSSSLELSNAGCGDWVVGDVAGSLKVNQAGSGDTMIGASGPAHLRLAGSGDVSTRAVGGGLQVEIAGAGGVKSTSVVGPLAVKIAGSGDVKIAGGRVDAMTVAVAGAGDVEFGGVAASLKARIAGSGDVKVKQVTGEVSKAVLGSGSVKIG